MSLVLAAGYRVPDFGHWWAALTGDLPRLPSLGAHHSNPRSRPPGCAPTPGAACPPARSALPLPCFHGVLRRVR